MYRRPPGPTRPTSPGRQLDPVAVGAHLVYDVPIGAVSLLHADAPEVRLALGVEVSDPVVVEAHADALIAMFLPERGGR